MQVHYGEGVATHTGPETCALRRAAPGVDEVTWDQYAENLEANLADLHARVNAGTYRAMPSRRKYIPKADGRQRLGHS